MRHPKGIDISGSAFGISYAYEHDGTSYDTLKDMPQWQVLGGKCSKCGHVAWLDKKAIIRKFGNQYLMHMGRLLKCRCGNKDDNKVMVGHMSRNV